MVMHHATGVDLLLDAMAQLASHDTLQSERVFGQRPSRILMWKLKSFMKTNEKIIGK
jgi:hypothetical protein